MKIMTNKGKYLWFTDTHLNQVAPWTFWRWLHRLSRAEVDGVFLTGDISNGIFLIPHLRLLSKNVSCPIYFILGNHDEHWSSFAQVKQKLLSLTSECPNLIWLSQQQPIKLTEEVALIGTEGWYDCRIGDPNYIRFAPDVLLINEIRERKSLKDKISLFRELSNESCRQIEEKLISALDRDFKTVYILTHMPCWKEASRDEGTLFEKYWLPYNCNIKLGETIEKVMAGRKKRDVVVLMGHTHCPEFIRVSRNIQCQVGAAGIKHTNSQIIYL
jgi:predicted phosphohydrolase